MIAVGAADLWVSLVCRHASSDANPDEFGAGLSKSRATLMHDYLKIIWVFRMKHSRKHGSFRQG